MKIYLARHGRTNYNDLGLCDNDPAADVHLTAAGLQQAQQLADALKNVAINRIFVSELKRTQQTAQKVNVYHGAPVQIDSRLNDIRTGFEGKPFKDFTEALDKADNRWTARINDGESVEDLKIRVANFIADLRTKNDAAVLIVTSLWVAQAMLAILDDITNDQAWQREVTQGSWLEREL